MPVDGSTPLRHDPVMLAETLDLLAPAPGRAYADATGGGGGHSAAIWPLIQPEGRLVIIDQDAAALAIARKREALASADGTIVWAHANFSVLPDVLKQANIARLDGGLLADLGVSSFQFDDGPRGFSFSKDAPLDMRMNSDGTGVTAATLLEEASEEELVQILSEYGEERLSKSIARELVAKRRQWPLRTTAELAALIENVYHRTLGRPRGRIHPATQTFQALRIAVNDELGSLRQLLGALPACLAPGARAVIISFHSLEDRLVKRAFRDGSRPGPHGEATHWRLLTPKPLRPSKAEVAANPRARSARLRAVEAI
ncbi:MAG: 16S rRNA (cytosine(1402)-N(4))-methyltransferase RsmH [Vampirovibrionales bacterium]|nr:16S rRNA (cytosine(1402)-N(4))-methyltransferase RsmH [Vampirovibrionales bacterium]